MWTTDSLIPLQRATRPGSFTGLMTLYESNFIRLGWLVRDPASVTDTVASTVPADCPLYLTLKSRTRYTTTLHLSYYFEENGVCIPDPDLDLRIYHDARLAEVMACTRRHRHAALRTFDPPDSTELDRRWMRNNMLNKWLEYCAEKGHNFDGVLKPG